MIEVFTDGSAIDNPGPGGWGAIVVDGDAKTVLSGGERRTTNNRMEILAAVKGLEALPEGVEVVVASDSQYVVNTMTRNWKRNRNLDLWQRLDAEVGKRLVSWRWVRGHAGNPLNEEADRVAVSEAQKAARGNPGVASGEARSAPVEPGAAKTESRVDRLTHLGESGEARMVDVGGKPETARVAVARGSILMKPETLNLIRANGFDKGDVLGVARIAGIMGAKSVAQLVPLCHPIPLDGVDLEFRLDTEQSSVSIEGTAKTTAKTGVEMEAMTAVSIAALTIYDMCKAVDRAMRIDGVRLVRKSGGKSGDIVLED